MYRFLGLCSLHGEFRNVVYFAQSEESVLTHQHKNLTNQIITNFTGLQRKYHFQLSKVSTVFTKHCVLWIQICNSFRPIGCSKYFSQPDSINIRKDYFLYIYFFKWNSKEIWLDWAKWFTILKSACINHKSVIVKTLICHKNVHTIF